MAGICCRVVGEGEASATLEPSSRTSRRRIMDVIPFNLIADVNSRKRSKLDLYRRGCDNAVENSVGDKGQSSDEDEQKEKVSGVLAGNHLERLCESTRQMEVEAERPKFGLASVCGRRRDMEDAVSIHPAFSDQKDLNRNEFHFFGVFDGHGCSHVAMKCKDRLHDIVKEEIEGEGGSVEWKRTMERSFERMDGEVKETGDDDGSYNCRCELRAPQCDTVGSTAVVAVISKDKIVVSNCGDSRAVLCRNGVAIPLSSDHKPDRPDELARIEEAGGRVIYWDGPRVLGVLAMSRAIGDNYLKPFVIPEPEVTMTDRTAEDECLILASDGLWDVVSNETACGVARMCLHAHNSESPPGSAGSPVWSVGSAVDGSNKACSDASILLTKLALARQSTDNVSVVVVDLRRNQQNP